LPEFRSFGPTTAPAIAELERAAQAVLEEARRRARDLARRRVEEAFRCAREEGLARGLREGRSEGARQALVEKRNRFARAARVLRSAARVVIESREAVRVQAEAGVVRLAAAIGEKLASRAIEADVDAAPGALREALAMVTDRSEVRVRVNPADIEALEAGRGTIREEFPEIVQIGFEADWTVAPGGCRAITCSATVDATLAERASRIAELLTGERGAA
jgi:flagellar biosynthesis/type III secretory pathway protein FliH